MPWQELVAHKTQSTCTRQQNKHHTAVIGP